MMPKMKIEDDNESQQTGDENYAGETETRRALGQKLKGTKKQPAAHEDDDQMDESHASSHDDDKPEQRASEQIRNRHPSRDPTGSAHFGPEKGDNKKYPASSGTSRYLAFLVALILTLIFLFLRYSSQASSNFVTPSRIEVDKPWVPPAAKHSIEAFHDELSTYSWRQRRPRVLQLEATNKHRTEVLELVSTLFPDHEFNKLTKDVIRGNAQLEENFFANFSKDRPLLVILLNAEKASKNELLSYAHEMSAEYFGRGEARRNAANVGFLFVGFSLPNQPMCDGLDLLIYDSAMLGWIHTFITRITYTAKIC